VPRVISGEQRPWHGHLGELVHEVAANWKASSG
jgi:hypothetical protein